MWLMVSALRVSVAQHRTAAAATQARFNIKRIARLTILKTYLQQQQLDAVSALGFSYKHVCTCAPECWVRASKNYW